MSSLLSFFCLDHDDTPLHCPRDKTALQEERSFGLPMYACAQCDGKWLASVHAAKLFSRLANPEGAVKEFQRQIEQESKPSSALCSQDGAPMRVIVQRGVTLDVCSKCRSIWFDGDELDQLLTHPADGKSFSRKTVATTAVLAGGALGLAAMQAANAQKTGDSTIGDSLLNSVDLVDVAGSLLELFDF